MKNMTLRTNGYVVFCVHGTSNPTEAEWQAAVDLAKATHAKYGKQRWIVQTLGGGPKKASQRRAIVSVLNRENDALVYVITGDAVTRGIVTALSWAGMPMKSGDPKDSKDLKVYLKLIEYLGIGGLMNVSTVTRILKSMLEDVVDDYDETRGFAALNKLLGRTTSRQTAQQDGKTTLFSPPGVGPKK